MNEQTDWQQSSPSELAFTSVISSSPNTVTPLLEANWHEVDVEVEAEPDEEEGESDVDMVMWLHSL